MNKLIFIFIFYSHYVIVRTLTLLNYVFGIKFWSFLRQNKTVSFFPAFHNNNAGYYFRLECWKKLLEADGYKVYVFKALKEKEYAKLSDPEKVGSFFFKLMFKRIFQIYASTISNTVIVRREILQFNDYGDLFYEKLLHSLHPNIILDFDDHISFAKKESRKISLYGKLLFETNLKFSKSLKLYRKFMVGNDFLRQIVKAQNVFVKDEDIFTLPTCVDYQRHEPKKYEDFDVPVIGWIGANNNQKYLDHILEDLNKLYEEYKFKMIVISGKPWLPVTSIPIENILWNINTETINLRKIDIGLMPLHGTEEDKGKCGFKLIQYMGMGILGIATDLEMHRLIVPDSSIGYLVKSNESWHDVLKKCLDEKKTWPEKGKNSRNHILKHFSHEAHYSNFKSFIS